MHKVTVLFLSGFLVTFAGLARLTRCTNFCDRHVPPGTQPGHALFRVNRGNDYRNAVPLFGLLQSLGYFRSAWCKDRMRTHSLRVLLEVDGNVLARQCTSLLVT